MVPSDFESPGVIEKILLKKNLILEPVFEVGQLLLYPVLDHSLLVVVLVEWAEAGF